MFHLIGELEGAKASGKIQSKDGKLLVKYVGTPAREVYVGYKDSEIVAGIQVKRSIIKELNNFESEVVIGFGEVDKILSLTGVSDTPDLNWDINDYVADKKPKGSTNKLKDKEYEAIETDAQYSKIIDVENLESIEQYVYRTKPLSVLSKEKNIDLSWVKEKDYKVLRTREEITNYLAELDAYDTNKKGNLPVAFDTETTGLECNRTKTDDLVGICMSMKLNTGVYFPLRQIGSPNIDMPIDEFLDLLKPYCDVDGAKAKKLVAHNGKFDKKVMMMYDWNLNIHFDTLALLALLDITKAGKALSLKGACTNLLGIDLLELTEVFDYPSLLEIKAVKNAIAKGATCDAITKRKLEGIFEAKDRKNELFDFRYVPEDFYEIYCPADGDLPLQLLTVLMPEWEKEGGKLDLTYNTEIALIDALAEQEYYGVPVVVDNFLEANAKGLARMEELEKAIFDLAGFEFKIGGTSTAVAVHDKCGVPHHPRYRTKSGGRSTDKHALKYYAEFRNADGSPRYPIVSMIQEYNKQKTLTGSFYGKIPKLSRGGFIFPSYSPLKVATGRLACAKPNIQQTEPASRKFMIPENDSKYFMICDYSQVEYRLMSGLAGEKGVVDFFTHNPEADYHVMAYSNMHQVPYASVTSSQRKLGKVLNFGTTYGLQDKALGLALYGDDNAPAQKKANAVRIQYFDGVPKIRDYFEKQRDIAQETTYATTAFGRRRKILEFVEAKTLPEGNSRRRMLIAKGRRTSGNMPVQGLAADIQKLALVRVQRNWRKNGYTPEQARLVLNVHDEICMQLDKSIHPDEAIRIMREAMEIDLSNLGIPPLYVGGNVGYSWYDGKADDLEAPVELMDRMVANAKAYKERGEVLQGVEDPKKYWKDAITEFNLEVLESEAKIGYEYPADSGEFLEIKTLDDAYQNIRIAKYATHHENKANYILGQVLVRGKEFVWANLEDLKVNQVYPLSVINRANTKYDNFEDAKHSVNLRNFSEFYEGFGGIILNHAIHSEVDIVNVDFNRKEAIVTSADGSTINYTAEEASEYNLVTKRKTGASGEELREDTVTLNNMIDSLVKVDEERNTIKVSGDTLSIKGLELLEYMYLPFDSYSEIKKEDSNEKVYGMYLDFRGLESKFEQGIIVVEGFKPFIRELFARELTGEKVDSLKDDIDSFIENNFDFK